MKWACRNAVARTKDKPHGISNGLIHAANALSISRDRYNERRGTDFIFFVSRVGSTLFGFPSRKRKPGVASAEAVVFFMKALLATVKLSPSAGAGLDAFRVADVWIEAARLGVECFAARVEWARSDLRAVAVISARFQAERAKRAGARKSGGNKNANLVFCVVQCRRNFIGSSRSSSRRMESF